MDSAQWIRMAVAGVSFWLALPVTAAIQVVGDEACEKYAVDIASFATCVDGKVTRAEDAPVAAARQARPLPVATASAAREVVPRPEAGARTQSIVRAGAAGN
jgi:hypothetical protein